MKSIINKISFEKKEFSIYFIGTIVAKLLTTILFFFLARKFTQGQLGQIEMYNTNINLIVPLASLQIGEACIRFLGVDKLENENLSNLVFIIFLETMGLIILECIFPKYHLFLTALTVIYCNFISFYARSIGKINYFRLPEILQKLILVVLVFILIDNGVNGYIYANIIGYLLSFIFITILMIKYIKIKFRYINFNNMKRILKYTVPLILNAISWWLITSTDRYFLQYYYGNDKVGIYSVAIKISGLIMMIVQNLYYVYQKKYIYCHQKNIKINNITSEKYFYSVFLVTLFSLFIPKNILIWLFGGNKYYDSVRYYYLFAPMIFYWALSVFFGIGYLITKKTRGASITTLFSALINIIINACLIKYYSIDGAIIATLISMFFWFFIRYITQKKVMKYQLKGIHWLCILIIQLISIIRYISM